MESSPASTKTASRPSAWILPGLVRFGDEENVIAVKVDNSDRYTEEATGTGFEWMGRAFNPNYGGLNHDIRLHLAWQDLPDAAAL